ncbi:MAG TPA: hypothetical protein IAC03_04350 [Candidatus Coprenecus pullistercoris]|nr:hypothetical protein [Candidatus Coprenecus pullistercoris]
MRQLTVVFLMLLIVCAPVSAKARKGSVTVQARENLLDKLPADVAYLLSEYTGAVLYRNDGGMSEGKINICLVDNSIRFVDEKGDTLLMRNPAMVNRIILADGSVCVPVNGEYVRQLAAAGSRSLVYRVRLELDTRDDSPSGGIAPPPTSTAVTASLMELDPSRSFSVTTVVDYDLSEGFCLTDGDKFYPARQSSFVRLFPDRKKDIKAYTKEHPVDYDSKEDITALFMYCAQGN